MPICKFAFSVNSSPAFINWALLLNIDGQSFRVAVTDNCELVIDNQWDSEPKNTSSGLGMDLKIASPVRNPATPPLWTLNMPPDNGKMCSGICWYSWSTQWAECSGAGWGALAVTQSPAPYLARHSQWSASQWPVIVLLRRIITPRSLLNTSVMIRPHSLFLEYSSGIPLIIKDLLNFSTAAHQIGAGLMRVCACVTMCPVSPQLACVCLLSAELSVSQSPAQVASCPPVPHYQAAAHSCHGATADPAQSWPSCQIRVLLCFETKTWTCILVEVPLW